MQHWQGIEAFIAVAELGSFTQAAKRMQTSVVQVSRQISQLEARLAVQLFYRTTRQVSLTALGEQFYHQCAPLYDGLQQAEQSLQDAQQVPQGLLKVTAPVTYGEQVLAPMLYQFIAQYEQLELSLHLTNEPLDLAAEQLDLAIRLGRLSDSRLVAKKLATRQLHVCATPDYFARFGAAESLSDLHRHQCLKGSHGHWFFRQQGRSITWPVQGRVQSNSGYALLTAARQGLGLVQLPDYYVQQDLASGKLVEVLTQYRDDQEGIWALYPQNRYLSPKVRCCIDYLATALQPQPHR
ncbi:HTH-type transcriptional regulator DmlR [Vibrio stylophorae]|uniref:HTH-type transcriptional regulator DmlR n=1 Tax=Vibrio stylophorae TaxID=659351 RepID=A0ABM8ZSI5_9VIBR|nr:LysR family transcriptional regulator [Vibrio stylophorae]CAH0532881.1 HTH-type transcriptional regulator DmlR [Vibrio stylophorae]